MRRGDAGHLVERSDKPENLAIDLDAFAEREDVGIARAHCGIDGNAALAFDAGLFGERGIGPNADRHHDKICRNKSAVFQLHGFDTRRAKADVAADELLCVGLGDDLDAAILDGLLQQMTCGDIELALHERRHEMEHGHIHALLFEAGCSFEAEEPAADNHRATAGFCSEQHRVDIVEIAIGEDAGQIMSGHRKNKGNRARRDDQLVVRRDLAVLRAHRLRFAVDLDDLVALVESNPALDVPAIAVDDDFLERLLA